MCIRDSSIASKVDRRATVVYCRATRTGSRRHGRDGMHRAFVAAVVAHALIAGFTARAAHAATVTGVVQDTHGTPIDMVGIAFVDSGTQQETASTTTGPDGTYAVIVPPATYDVHVQP